MERSPDPHPQIEPLAGLLGTWRGHGVGKYPTIASFEYDEEVRFWHTGRPWLGYEQKTKLADGSPAHSESGYWRVLPEERVEVVVAHAFGIVEIQEGTVSGGRIELRSRSLASSSSAKAVEELTRTLELNGDTLRYSVEMAFGDQPLQNHLEATLRRAR